jgi:hypothetical protein
MRSTLLGLETQDPAQSPRTERWNPQLGTMIRSNVFELLGFMASRLLSVRPSRNDRSWHVRGAVRRKRADVQRKSEVQPLSQRSLSGVEVFSSSPPRAPFRPSHSDAHTHAHRHAHTHARTPLRKQHARYRRA